MANRYISTTGNDTTGTGTEAAPWATVSKANTSATAGDTVYMRGGTYTGGTQVTKLLHFVKYPSEVPVVSGGTQGWDVRAGGSGGSCTGVTFTAATNHGAYIDGVTTAGYTFTNCISHTNGHSGINIIRSDNVTWDDGEVYGNAQTGIRDIGSSGSVDENTGTLIKNALIRDNGKTNTYPGSGGDGILIQGLNTTVRNCSVLRNGSDTVLEHGIYVAAVADAFLIEDCTLLNNAGSSIKADANGTIRRNSCRGAKSGVVLEGTGPGLVTISDNVIGGYRYAVQKTAAATTEADETRWLFSNNRYATGIFSGSGGTGMTTAAWVASTGESSTFVGGDPYMKHWLAQASGGDSPTVNVIAEVGDTLTWYLELNSTTVTLSTISGASRSSQTTVTNVVGASTRTYAGWAVGANGTGFTCGLSATATYVLHAIVWSGPIDASPLDTSASTSGTSLAPSSGSHDPVTTGEVIRTAYHGRTAGTTTSRPQQYEELTEAGATFQGAVVFKVQSNPGSEAATWAVGTSSSWTGGSFALTFTPEIVLIPGAGVASLLLGGL